jgi:hypothetical protein
MKISKKQDSVIEEANQERKRAATRASTALVSFDGKNAVVISENDDSSFSRDNTITGIVQPTELGESLKELNNDNIEPQTRMSGIDMRSRLVGFEISSVLALDSLVALQFLPIECLSFSRQKKRLAVSLMGKGRDDIVNVVAGKRENDAKMLTGLKDRAMNFTGMQGGEQR